MTRPAAIEGDYADFRLVRTRKVMQVVIEVPIEHAPRVLETLGFPDPAGGTPVAVALLSPVVEPVGATRSPKPTSAGSTPANGAKRRWAELSPAEQAGIRCNELDFTKWLDEEYGYMCASTPPLAAIAVRNVCGVASRAELNTNPEAAARWRKLDTDYQAATGYFAEDRS